jgi:hypothetical protein
VGAAGRIAIAIPTLLGLARQNAYGIPTAPTAGPTASRRSRSFGGGRLTRARAGTGFAALLEGGSAPGARLQDVMGSISLARRCVAS